MRSILSLLFKFLLLVMSVSLWYVVKVVKELMLSSRLVCLFVSMITQKVSAPLS